MRGMDLLKVFQRKMKIQVRTTKFSDFQRTHILSRPAKRKIQGQVAEFPDFQSYFSPPTLQRALDLQSLKIRKIFIPGVREILPVSGSGAGSGRAIRVATTRLGVAATSKDQRRSSVLIPSLCSAAPLGIPDLQSCSSAARSRPDPVSRCIDFTPRRFPFSIRASHIPLVRPVCLDTDSMELTMGSILAAYPSMSASRS